MAKQKEKKFWLSRDKLETENRGFYAISTKKKIPSYDEHGYAESDISFCPRLWHKVTGLHLRKGQTKQVKITHLKKGFKFELI